MTALTVYEAQTTHSRHLHVICKCYWQRYIPYLEWYRCRPNKFYRNNCKTMLPNCSIMQPLIIMLTSTPSKWRIIPFYAAITQAGLMKFFTKVRNQLTHQSHLELCLHSTKLFRWSVKTLQRLIQCHWRRNRGLFYNGKEAVPIVRALKEMGHKQPAASNPSSKATRQRRSKSMCMRFQWIQDRTNWKPRNYFTKHHFASHHRQILLTYLCTTNILISISASNKDVEFRYASIFRPNKNQPD